MKEPMRPATVPADAVWNSEEKEWQRGPLSKKKKPYPIGRWEYWREDGTLCCIANMDDEGLLDGICERFHEDGTLSFSGPFKKGHRHGHFVHIQSKNKTSERYPANKKTWRYEFDSNANWEDNNLRWFLEDGTECTSKGKPLEAAYDLDELLLNASPDNFLELHAEKIKRAIEANKNGQHDDDDDDYYYDEDEGEIDLSQVEELWGISPSQLHKFMAALHNTDSFAIRKSQRKFEADTNVWYRLIAYPWENTFEELAAVFMGAVQFGRFGDSDGVYTTLFSQKRKDPSPDFVYTWSHETYYIDEVVSLSQDDFAYRTAVSKAYEIERLSPRATRAAWRKLEGRTCEHWAASAGIDLEADEDEEVSDAPDFNVELDPDDSKRSSYWRSQWIQWLLASDNEREPMDEIRDVFRPGLNKPISDEEHKELVESGMRLPNNSCYFLWRYFWFKQEDRLQDCLRIFRDHPARIVRDLVKLIEEIYAGKTQIGDEIANILIVRDEFLKLGLCPEAGREQEAKAAAKSSAETELQSSMRERAELEFNKGTEALLDLAWSQVSNPLCIDEIEKFARKIPGNDLYWKAFDWVCKRGYERAGQPQRNEASSLAVWLGQQETGSRILQPFIWARLYKNDYASAALLLEGIGTNSRALDPRAEMVLLNQLEHVEEYNHKRELAVRLLGCIQAKQAIPRINALIDEFFKAMEKFSRSEVRNETFPWEALLLETAKTLGKFEAPETKLRSSVVQNLRKLFSFAVDNYQFKQAAAILETLCRWGESNLLPCIHGLRRGGDDPERWASLRTIERMADRLSNEELDDLSEYFPNPDDDDNAVTVLYHRAIHALAAVDKKERFKPQPISELMQDAEELSNYGDESWKEFRIVKCETVGKFAELDLRIIERYLYSADRDLRLAAEAAYSNRRVEPPVRRSLTWADVWRVADAAESTEAAAAELGRLIADPSSVDRTSVAGWLWENPSESSAKYLVELVKRELDQYSAPGHGENLSAELSWILRALARHANYPGVVELVEVCLKLDDKELSSAILHEVDSLPVSLAPLLLAIAADDAGWRRYLARWAARHQSNELVSKALKSAKITERKLASWSK